MECAEELIERATYARAPLERGRRSEEVRRVRMVERKVILVALACCLANVVRAEENLIEEEGEGRLG